MKHNGLCFPQIWYDDFTTGTGKFQHGEVNNDGPLVFFHHLNDDEKKLNIDELDKKFKEILNEKELMHYRNFKPCIVNSSESTREERVQFQLEQ